MSIMSLCSYQPSHWNEYLILRLLIESVASSLPCEGTTNGGIQRHESLRNSDYLINAEQALEKQTLSVVTYWKARCMNNWNLIYQLLLFCYPLYSCINIHCFPARHINFPNYFKRGIYRLSTYCWPSLTSRNLWELQSCFKENNWCDINRRCFYISEKCYESLVFEFWKMIKTFFFLNAINIGLPF